MLKYFDKGDFQPPVRTQHDNLISMEMKKLRNEKSLKLDLNFFEDTSDESLKIIINNTQSLKPHINYIASDVSLFRLATVIMLVETWSLKNDIFNIQGFECVQREDGILPRTGFGNISFARKKSGFKLFKKIRLIQSASCYVLLSCLKRKELYVCSVYRSAKYAFKKQTNNQRSFQQAMIEMIQAIKKDNNKAYIVLGGDYNININNGITKENIIDLMSSLGLRLLIPPNTPSTDGQTQIDLAFSNFIDGITAEYSESLLSYHKPIIITINSNV
jgi:hypothetical protein